MTAASSALVLLTFLAADGTNPPAGKEAYPDSEAALNDRLGKGITPDNNAVVLLWKAYGPPKPGTLPAEYFKRLGTPEPPAGGDAFVILATHLHDRTKLDESAVSAEQNHLVRACQRPWTATDYPHLAAWLAANEKPLAAVIEATTRPEYYEPLLSHKTDTSPGSIIDTIVVSVDHSRQFTYALTCRAMLRVGEGKFDAAWRDLTACHRLARLVARGGTLLELLVGIAIENITMLAEVGCLEGATLTTDQLRGRSKELQGLPPFPSAADKVDVAERYLMRDTLRRIGRGDFGLLWDPTGEPIPKLTPKGMKIWTGIDWKPAIPAANSRQDQLVAALRRPTRAERQKALDAIGAELEPVKEIKTGAALVKMVLADDPPDKFVARRVAYAVLAMAWESFRKFLDASDRNEQVRKNTHLAFALAAYRWDTGSYPAKLADLSPKYLAAVPNDLFSGKELVYRPSKAGYLLYSVGVNGTDEDGRGPTDTPAGDDIAVRMPLPELLK